MFDHLLQFAAMLQARAAQMKSVGSCRKDQPSAAIRETRNSADGERSVRSGRMSGAPKTAASFSSSALPTPSAVRIPSELTSPDLTVKLERRLVGLDSAFPPSMFYLLESGAVFLNLRARTSEVCAEDVLKSIV